LISICGKTSINADDEVSGSLKAFAVDFAIPASKYADGM